MEQFEVTASSPAGEDIVENHALFLSIRNYLIENDLELGKSYASTITAMYNMPLDR